MSCTKKLPNSMSLIGPAPKLPARISDRRSSRAGSARRRPASSIAYIAMLTFASPYSASSPPMISVSCPLVLRSAHAWMRGQSSRGSPTSSPITCVGRWAATSCTNSTSCCSRGAFQDAAADGADLSVHRADDLGLEARDERAPVVDVPGWVHRQQHVAHADEPGLVEVLHHHAALARREQHRLPRDGGEVGVLQHRPEPGLIRHVLPVDRLRAAELGEEFVRRGLDERVGIPELDHQSTRTFGRGRPCASHSA